jgi:hypothetical protein
MVSEPGASGTFAFHAFFRKALLLFSLAGITAFG